MEVLNYELEPNPRKIIVKSDDEIYLTIKIGNGQIGGSKIKISEDTIAKGNISQPTFIGQGSKIKEKEIEIETNILDVNSLTNICVFITTFYNQNNKKLYSKIDKGEAPDSGIASFKGKYIFGVLSIILLLFINLGNLNAQNPSEISFDDLETPSSPGFILLDNTPSSIDKPTTPQGFGVSILGFFNGTGGAMEFAPFWLKNHPKLTAEDMYKNKTPVWYNFSISGATVKTDSSHYVSGGLRTRLYQNYGNTNIEKLNSTKSELENALADLDLKKIEELKKKYSALIEKPVFSIDFAAAIGAGSESNSFNDFTISRWAAWLAFNYRPKGDDFYFTALTRYINNEQFEEYSEADLFDIGIRANYDISKFSVSLEYLQRLNLTSKDYKDNRVAIIGSYQISDNFFLTSTFGKNFSEVNNIIAIAGVNFGFSKSKIKAY